MGGKVEGENWGIKVGRKLKEKAGGKNWGFKFWENSLGNNWGKKGGKPQTVMKPLTYIQ